MKESYGEARATLNTGGGKIVALEGTAPKRVATSG
jgi:hypothetical protein